MVQFFTLQLFDQNKLRQEGGQSNPELNRVGSVVTVNGSDQVWEREKRIREEWKGEMEFSKEVESGEPPAEKFNGNDEEINGGRGYNADWDM